MTTESKSKRNKLIVGFIAVIGAGLGITYLLEPSNEVSTDDAYVAGHKYTVTSQVSGMVTALSAENTQVVKFGEPLMQINTNPLLNRVKASEANLTATYQQIQSQFDQLKSLHNQKTAITLQLRQAKHDLDRRTGGVESGTVVSEAYDHAITQVKVMTANLASLNAKISAAKAMLGADSAIDTAQVKAAETQLNQAYLDLINAHINSPSGGIIADRSAQIGQTIQAGQPLMTIVPTDQVWVDANFKENKLKDVKVGQPVTMTTDYYGDKVTYHGVVAGMHAGSGSSFSAIPAQNATGNWIKVIQRVPVRIELNPAELKAHPLVLGLSVSTTIDTSGKAPSTLKPAFKAQTITDVTAQKHQQAKQQVAAFVQHMVAH